MHQIPSSLSLSFPSSLPSPPPALFPLFPLSSLSSPSSLPSPPAPLFPFLPLLSSLSFPSSLPSPLTCLTELKPISSHNSCSISLRWRRVLILRREEVKRGRYVWTGKLSQITSAELTIFKNWKLIHFIRNSQAQYIEFNVFSSYMFLSISFSTSHWSAPSAAFTCPLWRCVCWWLEGVLISLYLYYMCTHTRQHTPIPTDSSNPDTGTESTTHQ